ncbi:EAL domain-containing protein [Aestuariibacter sp. AA17]|uniref:EAL domain-containing protein n=1 Tax=Fluctibacter corallii TaxID=2984329 RepID=A0ABT3AAK7_9ALTE|nr:EAL domain-containing protein [Aestuariibacter sp. AA17]MCV2885658.1 EAL domain-containing protein [Aestuariibacter sp. AA17]
MPDTDAFSLEHIVPFFQPIMDLKHDRVWRYECLARLVTPGEYIFLPNQFLHLIEREDSVAQFTETMFHRSAEYFRNTSIAWNLNLCEEDIADDTLFSMLKRVLDDYPNPNRVGFELTADTAHSDLPRFDHFLNNANALGVNVFLDHFGVAGDADMALLSRPITGIKIAGSVMSEISDSKQVRSHVAHLLDAADTQSINVIAEHIEDEDTLNDIMEIGIGYGQGFYFSTPQASAT